MPLNRAVILARGTGTRSVEFDVPANLRLDHKSVLIETDAAQAVLNDSAFRFRVSVEVFEGGEWVYLYGYEFQGGSNLGRGGTATPAPGIIASMARVEGRRIRITHTPLQGDRSVALAIRGAG